MDQLHIQKISRLMEDCPESCKCHRQEVEGLCKAKDTGLGFAECLDDRPFECSSSLHYANSYYCLCAPRVYMARYLKK